MGDGLFFFLLFMAPPLHKLLREVAAGGRADPSIVWPRGCALSAPFISLVRGSCTSSFLFLSLAAQPPVAGGRPHVFTGPVKSHPVSAFLCSVRYNDGS